MDGLAWDIYTYACKNIGRSDAPAKIMGKQVAVWAQELSDISRFQSLFGKGMKNISYI